MKHFPEVEYKTIEERDREREALLIEKQGWEKEREEHKQQYRKLNEEYVKVCTEYSELLDIASRLLANCTDTNTEVWRRILEERVSRV